MDNVEQLNEMIDAYTKVIKEYSQELNKVRECPPEDFEEEDFGFLEEYYQSIIKNAYKERANLLRQTFRLV